MLYPGNNNISQQGWQFKSTNTNGDPKTFIHSFIADCLRSYLITSSLPMHLWAMKNWNQKEKLIASIRFDLTLRNQLGIWIKTVRRLKIIFPPLPYPNSWLYPTHLSGPSFHFTLRKASCAYSELDNLSPLPFPYAFIGLQNFPFLLLSKLKLNNLGYN